LSEYGLRHITRMRTRSRQGRLAWNAAHSAAAACHIAPQSSALPLSACHVTPRKQPRIEASPFSGEVPRPKSKLRPSVAKYFTVPHTGEVAFLGPLGGVDMNYLYRDVRVPRRLALGLAICQLVKHVVATLRCGCEPSAAAAFKNYSAIPFMPNCLA
jgi:hypothetical protein